MTTRVKLPKTDLEVFPMGLGTAQAGLAFDKEEADRLFDLYLYLGGNLIDTARVYSDWVGPETGRSERVIGDWLKRSKKRHEIVLMTKGGHPDMTVGKPDLHKNRMSPNEMVKDLDLSLQTLGTDYIDLYFYHRDDENQPAEQLIEVMEGFVKAGKIRYYACSNWSAQRMLQADNYCAKMGYRGLAGNQVLYNLGSRYAKSFSDDTMAVMDDEMLDYHRNHPENVLMPYMGVCSGYFHKFVKLGEEAVKDSPYNSPQNVEIAKRLPFLMEKYHATISQVVLGFYTGQDVFSIPLYGAKNQEQLKDVMRTFEISFNKEDYMI